MRHIYIFVNWGQNLVLASRGTIEGAAIFVIGFTWLVSSERGVSPAIQNTSPQIYVYEAAKSDFVLICVLHVLTFC